MGTQTFCTKNQSHDLHKTEKTASLPLENLPVEYVSNFSFLGIVLDRKLNWGPHIARLKERSQKDLRLLSLLAHTKWSADYVSLRRIYTAVLLPKIEYGGFLFATAAPTHLLTLNRIQYAAARLILGALCCTRVDALEAEADLLPLPLRYNIQLAKYAARILSIPDHPLGSLVHDYYHYQLYNDSPYPIPIVGRIRQTFGELGISYKNIAKCSVSSRYATYDVHCRCSIGENSKQNLSEEQWQLVFTDMNCTYFPRTAIFTDGSVQGERSGCAVWSRDFQLKARLPDYSSSYTAELYAIYYALKFIIKLDGIYVIYTDSYSAIATMSKPTRAKHYLINTIQEMLHNQKKKVIIEWVPSHVGIVGNERADALAKESLTLPVSANIPIALPECSRTIMKYFKDKWQTMWTFGNAKHLEMKPMLVPTVPEQLSRSHQRIITRLRLNTCLFTHSHYFTSSPRPVCLSCSCILDIKHLLVDCPDYQVYREGIIKQCKTIKLPLTLKTLLNQNFPCDLVIKFFQDCHYLDKV